MYTFWHMSTGASSPDRSIPAALRAERAGVDSMSAAAIGGRPQDDLVELWRTLWSERWLLCLIVFVCTCVAAVYAFLAPQWFESEAILIPASPKSTQNLTSQLGNLGGLASLAGMNFLSGSGTSEPIAVLRSRDLLREFIEKNDLLPVLYADKWDPAALRWKDARPGKSPDLRDGVKYFQDHVLNVQEDKKTGLVTLDVDWTNPEQAEKWANELIDRVNERMRDRALSEAETSIAFLQSQLTSSSQASLQQAVSRLLENELQKAMLARGNKEFSFRVVDRPDVPKRSSRPKRGLTIALGFLTGGIVAVLVVFVKRAFESAPLRVAASSSDT